MQILPHFFLPGIRETELRCKKENHDRNRYNPRADALLPGDTAQELAQNPKLGGFWAPSPCEKEKEQDWDNPIDRYRLVMRNSCRGGREAFKNRLRRSCNKIPLKWDREEMVSRNKWKRKLLKREEGREETQLRSIPISPPLFLFSPGQIILFLSLSFFRENTRFVCETEG